MHLIIITLLLTTLLSLFTGVFVLSKKKKNFSYFFFAAYFLGLALWGGSLAANRFLYLLDPSITTFSFGSTYYFIEQIIFFAVVMLLTGKLWFIKSFPENRLPKSIWNYWPLFLSIIMVGVVFYQDTLFTFITIDPKGYATLDTGPFTQLYTLFVLFHYIYPPIILKRKMREIDNWIVRKQLQYLFWSHIAAVTLGTTMNWILPVYFGIPYLSPFGPVASFISVGAFAYAVTHYRFLDIKISFQRTLTYATAGLILTAFAWFILNSAELSRFNILLIDTVTVLTVIVAFLPLKKFLHCFFNLLIFHELKNYRERLHELVWQITKSGMRIEEAAQKVLTTLKEVLGLESCRFLPARQLAAIGGASQLLTDSGDIIYSEELEYRALQEGDDKSKNLAFQMKKNSISVLAPIRKNGELVGALAVQQKAGASIFSGGQLDDIGWVAENAALYFTNLKTADDADLANLQHEINSPLARALIRTENLRNRLKQKDIREEIAKIIQDIFQSSRTFYHFLEIQSLPKNKKLLQQPTALTPVITKVSDRLKWEFLRRGHTFAPKIKISSQSDFTVATHPILLGEAITELLLNAALFGDQKVALKVADLGKNILIEISNSGSLSKSQIEKALSRFGSFGEGSGSGLGLSFVQIFAESIGGSFTLRSIRQKVIAELELPKAPQ